MAVILDLLTPLVVPQLDVTGNASHWVMRTAGAALEKTRDNWLALFDSQDLWNAHDAGPAVVGFTPYVNTAFRSRRGVPSATIRNRFGRNFSKAWLKAVGNWNHAFRDQAEHFYDPLIDNQHHYEEATRLFLGLVGLNMADWLGAFSMHIMALCGNEAILDQPGGHTQFNQLAFPAPVIIPLPLRQALDHGLMALLCRDVYLTLFLGGHDFPNEALDAVLGGHLGFAYASPPASFMHVEARDGGYFLHTVIQGAPEHVSPRALDFHVPMPAFTGTGLRLPVVPDLYAYSVPGDLPLASGFIRLDHITGDVAEADLLLLRSDLPGTPL